MSEVVSRQESHFSRQSHAAEVATTAWAEDQVKAALRRRGIPTPPGTLLAADEPLPEIAHTYPLVVKVCSPNILHKTDVGGVVLDVRDAETLARVVGEMRARFPGESLLIESMEAKGIEVIVGVVRDPSFGPTIMFGLGGVLAELYKDVTFRMLPLSRSDAEDAIESIRGAALLAGFRGMKANRPALVDLLLAVSRLVEEWGDAIVQMDLNPVFVRADDVVVVDAKLLLREDAELSADS